MADHGHHRAPDDGAVNVHVHSWKLYASVLGALLFLTVVTVAAAYVDIDGFLALGGEVEGVGAWNLTVAVLIATSKAALVVMFFMHLKDDARFNSLILIGSVLFVGIFFAYTMNDTTIRGTMDAYNGVRVDPDTGLAAPGGIAAPIPGEELAPGVPEPAAEEEAAAEAAAPAEAAASAEGAAAEEAAAEEAAAEEAAAEEAAAAEEGTAAEEAPAEEAAAEEAAAEEAAPEEGAAPAEAEPAPAE